MQPRTSSSPVADAPGGFPVAIVLGQKFRCLIMSDPMIFLTLTGRLRLLVHPHRKAGAGPIGLPEEPVVTMTTLVADRSDRMSE